MDGRWCLENVVDRVWRRGRVLIDCLCVCGSNCVHMSIINHPHGFAEAFLRVEIKLRLAPGPYPRKGPTLMRLFHLH